MFGGKIEGICDNTVFGTLYTVYFFCLFLNRHIFVDNTDTALARHGNGHTVLGHGVHACTHQGNVKFDLLCKIGG